MTKIVKLSIADFKRIKAVEITPDGNLVTISGRNGQGKSSVLDAITAALGGTSTKALPKPIRDGEERAQIILETDKLVVTRTFTAKGSTLSVASVEGAVFKRGQSVLDELIGSLSLDPLEFTRLSDKDQLATLLEMVKLPFSPEELARERAEVFEERTEVNRRTKELAAKITGTALAADVPEEEVSVAELLTAVREGEKLNNEIDRAREAADYAETEVERLASMLEQAREQAAKARSYASEAPPKVDTDALMKRLEGAEETNAMVRANREVMELKNQHKTAETMAAALTAKIADIDKRKADGLAAVDFPVDGLAFDETGLTFNGVPFKQASSSEQLRVSLAMAMALNPELKVIRISDGSLLDSESLKLVESMAKAEDYQVWIEMVDETGASGVVIEDGAVA